MVDQIGTETLVLDAMALQSVRGDLMVLGEKNRPRTDQRPSDGAPPRGIRGLPETATSSLSAFIGDKWLSTADGGLVQAVLQCGTWATASFAVAHLGASDGLVSGAFTGARKCSATA